MNLGLLLGLPRLILISDLGQIPLIFQVLLTNMILTDLKRHVVFMMHLGYINQIFFNKMHFLLWWFLIKSNFLYHNNGSMQIWWAKSVSMCRFIHRFEMFYFLILGFAKQILNFLVKKIIVSWSSFPKEKWIQLCLTYKMYWTNWYLIHFSFKTMHSSIVKQTELHFSICFTKSKKTQKRGRFKVDLTTFELNWPQFYPCQVMNVPLSLFPLWY